MTAIALLDSAAAPLGYSPGRGAEGVITQWAPTQWRKVGPAYWERHRVLRQGRFAVEGVLTTPTGTYPGSYAYTGGVLLPDGRVFCVPFDATTARIYDPVTNTLTTPAGTYPMDGYLGGVLLPDGRVFCVPYEATTASIYDPVTDTLTTPTGTYPGGYAYAGGVLLPDGRVFCVPVYAATARIYDPVTDTLTTPAGTYPGSGAYAGGVLLPDGRVFCVPDSATKARIYGGIGAVPSARTLSAYDNKL